MLLAAEIPGLRELEEMKISQKWHAVYTDTNKAHHDIDNNRKLVDDFTYDTRVKAAAALIDYNQGYQKPEQEPKPAVNIYE